MRKTLLYVVTALIVAAMTVSCGNHASGHKETSEHNHEGHEHETHDHEKEHGHEHGHKNGVIEFSEEKAQAAGLETEKITAGKFSSVIRTSGEIMPAQGDEATVAATVSGIVSFGKAGIVPGKRVSAGSVIASVSAREMADGDPVAKSKAAYEAAEKELHRAEALLRSQAISQKVYEQAKRDYEVAKAEYDAYSGKMTEAGVAVKSPLTGSVKEVFVKEGDYVNAGQPLASVTQNTRLYLQADLSEKYWKEASSITGANFRPSYSDETYNLKSLGGRLVSVGKSSVQGSFYLPVIFEFQNRGNFIPGSFCEIYLTGMERDNVISVPETALTEEQGVYYVYLKLCKEDYKKQEVKTGESDGMRREILKGLKAGDVVVTKGALQVKLSAVSGTIPGHTHNH